MSEVTPFRQELERYLKKVGRSKKDLANEIGIEYTWFSTKLNGNNPKAKLTVLEAKSIVKVLVTWETISKRSEALKLIELAGFDTFTTQEWEEAPLKKLEIDDITVQKDPFNNLPAEVNSLIGRENEIANIKDRLLKPYNQLITLIGPGGVGKTRLALSLAWQMLDTFRDGVYFVDLTTINDPELVVVAIAQVLKVKQIGNGTLTEAVLEELVNNPQMLLILDNFEHLLADVSISLIREIIKVAPKIRLIATSRAALSVYGENEFRLEPLKLPDSNVVGKLTIQKLQTYPAVRLFVERARDTKSTFVVTNENSAIIAELCNRLDGIPLAIELAAIRVKLNTPAQILLRLDKRFELLNEGPKSLPLRQQSLQASLDWSYQLLNKEEQTVFQKLSCFRGGFTLESGRIVCDLSENAFERILSKLLDESLVRSSENEVAGELRFSMLETIREYGIEKLKEAGSLEQAYTAYNGFFLNLAEKAEPELVGSSQAKWLAKLDQELDNLRASLNLYYQTDHISSMLALAAALGRFWVTRAYFSEGNYWLQQGLDKFNDRNVTEADSILFGKAKYMIALITLRRGNLSKALVEYNTALTVFEQLHYKPGIADTSKGLGLIFYYQDELDQAVEYYKKCLQIYEELNNSQGVADVLTNLGAIMNKKGEIALSQQLFEQALAKRRQIGNKLSIADSLINLGILANHSGEYEKSEAFLKESLVYYNDIGSSRSIPAALMNLAELYYNLRNYIQAQDFYQQAIVLLQQQNSTENLSESLLGLGNSFYSQGLVDEALSSFHEALSVAKRVGEVSKIAAALSKIGMIFLAQGEIDDAEAFIKGSLQKFDCDYDTSAAVLDVAAQFAYKKKQYVEATKLLGASTSMFEKLNYKRGIADLTRVRDLTLALQSKLGEQIYESVWIERREMSLEEANRLLSLPSEKLLAR